MTRHLVCLSIGALLIGARGDDQFPHQSSPGVVAWDELKERALRGVNSSSLSDTALIIRYQRILIVNDSDGGGASVPGDTRDEWAGELRIANNRLYLMERLVKATPELQVDAPRIPIRRGFSFSGEEFRSIEMFEEPASLDYPRIYTIAEIHRGMERGVGLPMVLTEQDYRGFLEKITDATLSAEGDSSNEWNVNGSFVNRGPVRDVFLKFSTGDSQAHLTRAVVSLGRSGADMKFEGWRTFGGYSLPGGIAIDRRDETGRIASREELRIEEPPAVVKMEASLFHLEIPPFSRVLDSTLGVTVTYQAGRRLPTPAELEAISVKGARARVDYFQSAMQETPVSLNWAVFISIVAALTLLCFIFRRKFG